MDETLLNQQAEVNTQANQQTQKEMLRDWLFRLSTL